MKDWYLERWKDDIWKDERCEYGKVNGCSVKRWKIDIWKDERLESGKMNGWNPEKWKVGIRKDVIFCYLDRYRMVSRKIKVFIRKDERSYSKSWKGGFVKNEKEVPEKMCWCPKRLLKSHEIINFQWKEWSWICRG